MMKRRSGSSSPIECRPFTNEPSRSIRASAGAPMRVMMRMLATTYGESVISTPQRDSGESIGPMQYGTTYMRAALHAAVEQRVHVRVAVGRRHPVVVRTGIVLLAACRRRSGARRGRRRPGANGAASCRGWVLRVERQQGAVGLHLRDQRGVLGIAAVAPVDRVGLGQRGDLRPPRRSARPACCPRFRWRRPELSMRSMELRSRQQSSQPGLVRIKK